jgi:hypothetical protein
MADEKRPEAGEQTRPTKSPAGAPTTKAEARARLKIATDAVGPDLASAAARAVAQMRLGFANRGAQIGFLDDIVDFTGDVVDVTEEVINHIAANTEELTHLTEEITEEACPLLIVLATAIGIASEAGVTPVGGTEDPKGASARQLMEARKAILEATAVQKQGLKAMADSLRAQIAAMRRPKT